MFKSLRDKFSSWLKKPEEEKEKVEEKVAPAPEKEPEKEEKTIEEPKEEKTEKKEGFFKRLFKGKKEEDKKEDTEDIKKQEEEKQKKEQEEKKIDELEQQLKSMEQDLSKEKDKIQKEKDKGKKKEEKKKKEILEEHLKELEEQIEKEKQVLETPKEEKIIEKPKEEIKSVQKIEVKEEIKEEKEGFFTRLTKKLSTSTLTQEQFDEIFPDLEITLLENNVALEVVDKIHNELSKDLVGVEVKKNKIEETIINSLKEAINTILIEPPNLIDLIKEKEGIFTIIFVGINGSGKTTTIAKVANLLKQNKISCVLAAGDTFRAASIEQLKLHAQKIDVPIVSSNYGTDPASVAFDAKKYAEAHNIKVVLIDTAGRMYTKTNLIKEMEKIVRISKPDLKIFVAESITGNDATEQAKTFNEAISIDGIILTKADVDEKAGTILSVSQITNKPIFFLGTGQSYSDLTIFSKEGVLKNLGLK